MKLSFIVPIYNVEPYLQKCVDSLLHQDYDDYEIILVDDGSTDGSGQLADEIASDVKCNAGAMENGICSPEIRVIHQENRGLSGSRNTGITAARGEYICFVDSDDYWEENVLRELMEQIERDNLDVLRFDYRNVNENGEEIQPNKNPRKYADYSSNVCDGERFLNERLGFACYVPMFIVKREMLGEAGYRKRGTGTEKCLFKEGVYFEDTDWTPRMLMRAKRVASTEMVVYNYLWRVGSITNAVSKEKKRKVLEDKIKLLTGFQEQRKMVRDDSWYRWQIASGAMSVLNIIAKDFYDEKKKYIQQIKNKNVFPLSTYRSTKNMQIKIAVANVSPMLYCMISKWILK